MPITTLDEVTALIVIDLQKGIASVPSVHPIPDVVQKGVELAEAFRRARLPVVLVTANATPTGRTEHSHGGGTYPPDFAELMPEMNRQPNDHVVSKQTWGAFTGTDLNTYLKSNVVTQVVICGVATSMGVESTARQAHELGYNVTLPTDAMTDLSVEAHANSIERIFPRLGETGTTEDIIDRVGAINRQ